MTKLKVFDEMDAPDTSGTSLKGYVNATYDELFDLLGEPTFNEESGDGKVQVEWNVKYLDEVFTIYDWKTYNRDFTLNKLDVFNVGGKTYAGDFIEYLEKRLQNMH